MNTVDNIHEALGFLRGIYSAFKKTTIDCSIDNLIEGNLISGGLCTLDGIKRNDYVTEDAKTLYDAALMCSSHDVLHADLHKDLAFLFQFANEIRSIINSVVSVDDESSGLSRVVDGLTNIINSISFGNPALPDESGAGIALAVMDVLLHRECYHAIYKGFTNSTPLAKYFIVINTLNRRTTCSIIAK